MMYRGRCDNGEYGCGEEWSVALAKRYTEGIYFRCSCGRIINLPYESNVSDKQADLISPKLDLTNRMNTGL